MNNNNLLMNLEEIKKNYERYKLILESSNDSIWDWDIKNNSYFISVKENDLFSYDKKDLDFLNFWKELLHPDDKDKAIQVLESFIVGKENTYENTYRIKMKNGLYYWIHSSGFAQRDEFGKITRIAGYHKNISKKVELEEQLYKATYYDSLTKLPNKNKIKKNFNKILISKQNKTKIAFIYIDIDNFNYINNTLGYKIGNELIKEVASSLKKHYGDSHYIARLNSDKFLVLFINYENIPTLKKEVKNLVEIFRNLPFSKEQKTYVSISVGVSLYKEHGDEFYDLLKYSDTALYFAKLSGKDRYVFYENKMIEDVYNPMYLTNQIRQAFEKNEFQMHYQPIIDVNTGLMVGAEALIRWNHSSKGFISPQDFIPIAETSGQIVKIEYWVIEEVCKQIKKWIKLNFKLPFISVNLSAKGLIEKDLVSYLTIMLEKYNISSIDIELEVTETALIHNMKHSLIVLNQLKEKGFNISLDDFGVGYSSLNYLKILPIDKVKLDKSLIDSIDKNKKDDTLLKHIIELAHAMDLKVVAEGVETSEQSNLLKSMNCDYIQGYYYGKPQNSNMLYKYYKKSQKLYLLSVICMKLLFIFIR